MKLLGERSFSWRDQKREVMVFIAKGQEFEADEGDEETAKEIYNLLQSEKATVIDDRFIKPEGDYVGLRNFEQQRPDDGSWLRVKPGRTVHLGQRDACRLLVGGFIKPEMEKSWIPKKLLAGGISVREPKRMFDEPLPPGENWIRKAMR